MLIKAVVLIVLRYGKLLLEAPWEANVIRSK